MDEAQKLLNELKKVSTTAHKIEILSEMIANHIWHRLKFQDVKLNFILVMLGLVIALIGVTATLALR